MKRTVLFAIFVSAIMALSAVSVITMNSSSGFGANSSAAVHTGTGKNLNYILPSASSNAASPLSPSSSSAWTYPTTTMQEPGYTNGTYKMAMASNVGTTNYFAANTVCDSLLLDEIYSPLVQELPNFTYVPWLATNYHVSKDPNLTTFNPVTGQNTSYNYTVTVNLRPNVQWTDWTPANAQSTYTFSNNTQFNLATLYSNGTVNYTTHYNYTYKSFNSTVMKTHYLQSADVVLSWRMLSSYGLAPNVVNVIPNGNLTVKYLLSKDTLLFLEDVLTLDVLPYHIWAPHSYSNSPGLWNYSASLPNKEAYNVWNLGWNAKTGSVPSLVGTGPYMVTNSYGMPAGSVITSHYFRLYVNPHYFVQYANASSGLRQYTPKLYSIDFVYYTSASNEVTAFIKGDVNTVEQGVTPNFLPQINSVPGSFIYHKPSSGYGWIGLNTEYSPLNVTNFRQALNYATPKAYLASVVDQGYTTLGQSLIPPSDSAFHDSSVASFAFNMAKARSLINATPGMSYKAGQLYYYGKAVSITIQSTSSAETPLAVQSALIVQNDWEKLGIQVNVVEEAFTTLISNLVNHYSTAPLAYQALLLGEDNIYGDPALDFQEFYNSNVGVATCAYLGPFSSLSASQASSAGLSDHSYSGAQINSLMNNLTNEMTNTNNLTKARQYSNEMQAIGAQETPLINQGYPIDIYPFTTTQFSNQSTTNTMPLLGYWYWNFLQITKSSSSGPTSTYSSSLSEKITSSSSSYSNGQYGNLTITITKGGNPVKGAVVDVGNPGGAIVNDTKTVLTTDSNGQVKFGFQVEEAQNNIYANGYSLGLLQVTDSAYVPNSTTVKPVFGSYNLTIAPKGIELHYSGSMTLTSTNKQLFSLTLTNSAGTPLSGFRYSLGSMTGAILMSPYNSSQAQLNGSMPFDICTGSYVNSVMTNNGPDINYTMISGTTGSNGMIKVWAQENTSYYFDGSATSTNYLFLGNLPLGGAVQGEPGFMVPAQVTSNYNAKPGHMQPIEFPVVLTNTSSPVKLSLKVSSSSISYDGSTTLTVTATNAKTGAVMKNYTVDLMAQDALGGGRGVFASGSFFNASNPNSIYYSTSLEAVKLVTDSSGQASVKFMPNFYAIKDNSSGLFYTAMNYSNGFVPADSFIITAMSGNTTAGQAVNATVVNAASGTQATTSPTSGLPTMDYVYIGIGVAIAAVVVGVVATVFRRKKA